MKHLKILGLAAVAALALMAAVGAATASAEAVVCSTSPTGMIPNAKCTTGLQVLNGTTIDTSLKPGTVVELTSTFDNIKCSQSTVQGTVTNSATGTGNIESMTFSGCTDSFGGNCTADTSASSTNKWPVTVTANKEPHNGSGTMTVSNITGKFVCPVGTCRYTASSNSTGITGGEPATLTTTKAALTREEVSSFGCSSTATLTGAYTQTSPTATNGFWLY
jgi:hypothetical protein